MRSRVFHSKNEGFYIVAFMENCKHQRASIFRTFSRYINRRKCWKSWRINGSLCCDTLKGMTCNILFEDALSGSFDFPVACHVIIVENNISCNCSR